jgi:hypothetical protein
MNGGRDYHTQTTGIVKNAKTDEEVDMVKLLEYKDNEKLYLRTYGLLKMPKGLDFVDEFEKMVKNIYDSLNYDPMKNKYDIEPHVEFVPSPQGAKYNKVFGKFREFLIANKDDIATKLVAGVANATFTVEYLTMTDSSGQHEFVYVPPSATALVAPPVSEDVAIEALHTFFEIITEDDYTNPPLSPEEMTVITDPDNYENAIFVIGQVFGIIAPDFDGDLLTFDNDKMNLLFDPQIFIDLFNKIKPDDSGDIIKKEDIEGLIL